MSKPTNVDAALQTAKESPECPKPSGDSSPPKNKSWLQCNYPVLSLLTFAMIPVTFFFITIFRSDVTIGAPTTEQDALIRANERLLQMAQWTIGTILTLGVALIGFNWIVSSRNHDRDREALRDHQEILSRYSEIALERQRDLIDGLVQQMNYNRSENREQMQVLREDIRSVRTTVSEREIIELRTRFSLGQLLVDNWSNRLRELVEQKSHVYYLLLTLQTASYDLRIFNQDETTNHFIEAIIPILRQAAQTDLPTVPVFDNMKERAQSSVQPFIEFLEKKKPEGWEEVMALTQELVRQSMVDGGEV